MSQPHYSLVLEARRFTSLGYQVGLTAGKTLVCQYATSLVMPTNITGISILLKNIVCVDFDTDFFDLGYERDLPTTLKEKTPRGWHLFYDLPTTVKGSSQINFKPNVDLLVEGAKKTKYRGDDTFAAHALCYPTPGYQRVYPDAMPHRDQLTTAPKWIQEEIKK